MGPSDGGSTTNYSWDQGGSAADQRAAARVGFAFLMLSAGTPLMMGGDEYLRSLQCNNNAYNVDSVGNWLNYSWTTNQNNFNAFMHGMIAFRKAHAALRPLNFYSSAQLAWWTPAGTTPDANYFNSGSNHTIAYQLNGSVLGDSYSSIFVACARQRRELVSRDRYLQLGRGPRAGTGTWRGGLDWRTGLRVCLMPSRRVSVGGEVSLQVSRPEASTCK